jgi:dTDP-glucose 4,6-dehydratase
MTILVTGGCGFIGSNFILDWMKATSEPVINLDKLTYAGNLASLAAVEDDPRYSFVRAGIEDFSTVIDLLRTHVVRAIVNFAAESHVDRSIDNPEAFVQTNIVGTSRLLEAALAHASDTGVSAFRFVHISTDEVFGTLSPESPASTESSRYAPNSPYAATKAGSDHLVRAYHETFGLPTLTTNCSNNYGPLQFPEKLIPLIIHNALAGKELPIYGDGTQVRDWLYVGDHCSAIRRVLEAGIPGSTYNIGGNSEKQNVEVVREICRILDDRQPRSDGRPYSDQIAFVKDRPGHDRRYAINADRIRRELDWAPVETFETGLKKTVSWYLANTRWVENVTSGSYTDWIARQYA